MPEALLATRPVRVIDTGIRGGRENIAFDQALIEAHNAGRIAQTVRFLRFRPCALVGLHQILGHEVRLDYCARHGIEVGRRITGGGGLYLDEGQIGWELVLERHGLGADLAAIAARICTAAAAGLRRLGVPAEFRPRNDIEVHGRKIAGTGGLIDGRTLFFQGTLLIDFDPARMIEALRVPVEKLAKRDLDDARRRVVTLREALGRVLAQRLAEIAALAERAETAPGRKPDAVRGRLARQVAVLLEASDRFDADRLHQEAILIAAKADVREELDRLHAHVAQANQLVEKGGAIGRRLDFLAQELNREANTLCAKANDIELSKIGLELKSAVEQFREQVQNLE